MRCLKSVSTERRDEYNRLILKGVLIGFAAFCIICVSHNLLYPEKFTNHYPVIGFLALLALYPLHKLAQYLICLPYLDLQAFKWRVHFYIVPCVHLKRTKIIPKWLYIGSLFFPFFAISALLIGLAVSLPIAHDWLFLTLIAVHVGMSSLDFLILKQIWATPKKCYIEHAQNGVSILISD